MKYIHHYIHCLQEFLNGIRVGGVFRSGILIISVVALMACSAGGSPLGGGGTLGGGASAPDSGFSGGGDDSDVFEGGGGTDNSGPGSTSPGEETGVPGTDSPGMLPQGSIPAPSLRNMMVASADSQSTVPVIGFEGAIGADYTSGEYQVLVSTNPIDNNQLASLSLMRRGIGALRNPVALTLPQPRSSFSLLSLLNVPNAHATNIEFNPNEVPVHATACDRAGVSCCNISEAGSFECYAPGSNSDTFYTYLTDGQKIVSDATQTKPNTKALWLAEQPKSLSAGHTELGALNNQPANKHLSFALASQSGKKIATQEIPDGGLTHFVIGDHENQYTNFKAQGDRLVYDKNNQVMGVLSKDKGIELKEIEENGEYGDEGVVRQVEGAIEYRGLKIASDGELRFIAKRENVDKPLILHALDGVQLRNQENDGEAGLRRSRKILLDEDANYKEPIAYDTLTLQNCTLLLYKDTQDAHRIKMACTKNKAFYPEFGGAEVLAGTDEKSKFTDMVIYHHTVNQGTIDGKALLIDQGTAKLHQIDFHNPLAMKRAQDPATLTNELKDDNTLDLGAGFTALTFSDDKKHLYTINKTSDTLNSYDLFAEDGTPLTMAQIKATQKITNLKDHLKLSGSLKPNSITYRQISDTQATLLIGLENAKSLLAIDI